MEHGDGSPVHPARTSLMVFLCAPTIRYRAPQHQPKPVPQCLRVSFSRARRKQGRSTIQPAAVRPLRVRCCGTSTGSCYPPARHSSWTLACGCSADTCVRGRPPRPGLAACSSTVITRKWRRLGSAIGRKSSARVSSCAAAFRFSRTVYVSSASCDDATSHIRSKFGSG